MNDDAEKRRRRLDEIRAKHERTAAELRAKMKYASEQADLRSKTQIELKHQDFLNRRALFKEKWELDDSRDSQRMEESLALEELRFNLRQRERGPNFEDHRMRAELAYLIGKQERLDGNAMDNMALERRITELRHMSRADIRQLVLIAVVEHIQSENNHRRTVAELDAETQNEMLKAEQAHGHQLEKDRAAHELKTLQEDHGHRHRIAQDDNASRLRVSEIFSTKVLDLVFAQMGGQISGLSRTDVDDLISQWEDEGDRLKK